MRKHKIAITIDYEVWDPNEVPEDKKDDFSIDFQRDVVGNTNILLQIADEVGAKLTIMAEMGEYLWLKRNQPEMAQKIAEQWRNAVHRGHDVQLHLHPNWLPETGACFSPYYANPALSHLDQYPFDAATMISRCIKELEREILPVKPDYKVICYRAGGYRVQPFEKTSNALQKCHIFADSSVYKGGKSDVRKYNFRNCKVNSLPYAASIYDPSKQDSESNFFEIPIYTIQKGKCWSMDYSGSKRLYYQFINGKRKEHEKEKNYFVMIGHSKAPHDFLALKHQLMLLADYPGIEFVTLSEVVKNLQDCRCLFKKAQCNFEEVQEIAKAIAKRGKHTETIKNNHSLAEKPDEWEKTDFAIRLFRQWGYRCYGVELSDTYKKSSGKTDKKTKLLLQLFLKNLTCTVDPDSGEVVPHAVGKLLCVPQTEEEKDFLCDKADFFQKSSYAHFYMRRFWMLPEEKLSTGRRYELCRRLKNMCLFSLPYAWPTKIR